MASPYGGVRFLCVCVAAIVAITCTSSFAGAAVAPGRALTAPGLSIWVSPWGNDSNAGTQAGPIRTLSHATAMVSAYRRARSESITIFLESGLYRLTSPLMLGPKQSGTDSHPVTWRSAPGTTAAISGAERISGWRLSDKTKHIWSASVPSGLRTRQIYVDGMRANLATGVAPVSLVRTVTGYTASSPAMSKWRNPDQIDFGYVAQLGQMSEQICPVASIQGEAITMVEPCWSNSTKRKWNWNMISCCSLGTPNFIENAYELLDSPGQFYLDQTAHRLYYIPRPGENMQTADVEVPVLQTLMIVEGSVTTPARDMTFEGIRFEYATWLQPSTPTGFSEMQANYTLTGSNAWSKEGVCTLATGGECPYGSWSKEPGNIQLRNNRHVDFLDDVFVHLGAAGLNVGDGSQHDSIKGCVFTDISGNGIEIGGVDLPSASLPRQTVAIDVIDNHLYGLPAEYVGGVAVLAGYLANSEISHNQIDHVGYTGISIGWGGWLDKLGLPPEPNYSHDNVIGDNVVFDFLQALSDGAGIYLQGMQGQTLTHGTLVTGNVVHGALAWGHGIDADNGVANATYRDNVLYDNAYDWGAFRPNTVTKVGYFPQLVEGNFSEQVITDQDDDGAVSQGNTIIDGPDQATSPIVAAAGIRAPFQFALAPISGVTGIPEPPTRVGVLYSYAGNAYVTWHPSYASAGASIRSYTVEGCLQSSGSDPNVCDAGGVAPITIASATYDTFGYVHFADLGADQTYRFRVIATTSRGSSSPSLVSPPSIPGGDAPPPPPDAAASVTVTPGPDAVSVLWYPPKSSYGPDAVPVLSYRLACSDGQQWTITGPGLLQKENNGAHVLRVVGGLDPGESYTFSVAAITPGGEGPVLSSSAVSPSN